MTMTCGRCGALKADHMDYGRGQLVCPRVEGGTFTTARTAWERHPVIVHIRECARCRALRPCPDLIIVARDVHPATAEGGAR